MRIGINERKGNFGNYFGSFWPSTLLGLIFRLPSKLNSKIGAMDEGGERETTEWNLIHHTGWLDWSFLNEQIQNESSEEIDDSHGTRHRKRERENEWVEKKNDEDNRENRGKRRSNTNWTNTWSFMFRSSYFATNFFFPLPFSPPLSFFHVFARFFCRLVFRFWFISAGPTKLRSRSFQGDVFSQIKREGENEVIDILPV